VEEFSKALNEELVVPKMEETAVQANLPTQELPQKPDDQTEGITLGVANPQPDGTLELLETEIVPPEKDSSELINFPLETQGEVYYVGEGITSIVGDARIPSGTTVDSTLVVKGTLSVEEHCRLTKNIKALKDVAIGPNTNVEGNLVAGGKVVVGSHSIVHGSIDSDGDVEIKSEAVVEGEIRSKSAIILDESAKVLNAVYATKGLSAMKATQNV
jgi:cytoskeletal protein CcmA (bactofilin family)